MSGAGEHGAKAWTSFAVGCIVGVAVTANVLLAVQMAADLDEGIAGLSTAVGMLVASAVMLLVAGLCYGAALKANDRPQRRSTTPEHPEASL